MKQLVSVSLLLIFMSACNLAEKIQPIDEGPEIGSATINGKKEMFYEDGSIAMTDSFEEEIVISLPTKGVTNYLRFDLTTNAIAEGRYSTSARSLELTAWALSSPLSGTELKLNIQKDSFLNITKLDTKSKIIEGEFEFHAFLKNGQPLTVTNGTFKMTL